MLAAFLWSAVIFFSSTNLAGEWSSGAFVSLAGFSRRWFFLRLATPKISWISEKSVHIVLFLVLAVLTGKSIHSSRHLQGYSFRDLIRIALPCIAIAFASEWLQAFFPGRDATVRDFLFDVSGMLLGLATLLA